VVRMMTAIYVDMRRSNNTNGNVQQSTEVAAVIVDATTKAPRTLGHYNPRITGRRKFVTVLS
jgi:galactokinase